MTPAELAYRFQQAQRRKRTGLRIPKGATCAKCDQPYYASGLCNKHYFRQRYQRRADHRRAVAAEHIATLRELAKTQVRYADAIRWALSRTAFPVDAPEVTNG